MANASGDSPFWPAFERLPADVPEVFRKQLLVGSGERAVLEGQMDRIWVRWPWLLPLFRLLGIAGLLPERTGKNVPVTLTISGHKGRNGWSRQMWRRRFDFRRPKQMVTSTVYDTTMGAAFDRLGPLGVFEVRWALEFEAPGTLTLRGDSWRLRLGPLILPLPSKLTGTPRVVQTAAGEDAMHISFVNEVPVVGEVFGYEGRFRVRGEAR